MLASLAKSQFSVWLLESDSAWGYASVLTLHTFGMMVLVGAALIIDARLLGMSTEIPLPSLDRLFTLMWSAFALNAITGTMLFVANADIRGTQLLFWTKLALVAVGLVATAMIRRRGFRADAESVVVEGTSRGLAFVSILAWLGAITAGRLLAYFV